MPERVALVGVDFGKPDFQAGLAELTLLARSAGAEVITTLTGRRASPDSAVFVGRGKADEVREAVVAHDLNLVIFNHALSPVQQRNLEKVLECRVIDRAGLILDIFVQRARSHEGKLQVQLAQLQYLKTRLVGSWSHLERQKGGIGLRGGPGETQIEIDRRLIDDRVKKLRASLVKLNSQRKTQRRSRQRNGVFSVSLVGYTNAGKSTLFNTLAKADAYVADQLFATLDTKSRQVYLNDTRQIVLSDTVGFISDLPHLLVAAFRSTLEEVKYADLLLHVVDASSPMKQEQIDQVNLVLNEIGATEVPQMMVCNKIDSVPELFDEGARIERDETGKPTRVFISAQQNIGLDCLRLAIEEYIAALQ